MSQSTKLWLLHALLIHVTLSVDAYTHCSFRALVQLEDVEMTQAPLSTCHIWSSQVTPLVDASATAQRVRALGQLADDGREASDSERPGFEMGLRLLNDMKQSGLTPDAITYTVGV